MLDFARNVLKLSDEEIAASWGYSDSEISKIEDFYDIKAAGDLLHFLRVCGRSAGNTLFEGFVFYWGYYSDKRPRGVSGKVIAQYDFRNDLLKYGRPFSTGKPLLFSIEYETQYYFLRTRADEPLRGITPEDDYSQLSENPEIVYHYDENEETVRNTGITFREYLQTQAKRVPVKGEGYGEMIVI